MQNTLDQGVISMKNSCNLMPSEVSSELELGLGLSLGSGRILLTAKDFCPSSSSSVTKADDNNNGSCGTKRIAEPSSPPARSQVVGWPPVRTYRMNSLANQAKSSPVTEDFFSTFDKSKSNNIVLDKNNYGSNRANNITKEKGLQKKSLFVKVKMDGIPIGREVDLNAHTCYESLARVLDDMFGARRSNMEEQIVRASTRQSGRLLEGSCEFVLTYEDKDGDWMLVGDVPWDSQDLMNSIEHKEYFQDMKHRDVIIVYTSQKSFC